MGKEHEKITKQGFHILWLSLLFFMSSIHRVLWDLFMRNVKSWTTQGNSLFSPSMMITCWRHCYDFLWYYFSHSIFIPLPPHPPLVHKFFSIRKKTVRIFMSNSKNYFEVNALKIKLYFHDNDFGMFHSRFLFFSFVMLWLLHNLFF